MASALFKGENIHNPGAISIGVMKDIGWQTVPFEFSPIPGLVVLGLYALWAKYQRQRKASSDRQETPKQLVGASSSNKK